MSSFVFVILFKCVFIRNSLVFAEDVNSSSNEIVSVKPDLSSNSNETTTTNSPGDSESICDQIDVNFCEFEPTYVDISKAIGCESLEVFFDIENPKFGLDFNITQISNCSDKNGSVVISNARDLSLVRKKVTCEKMEDETITIPEFIPDQKVEIIFENFGASQFQISFICKRLEDFVELSTQAAVIYSPNYPISSPDYSVIYYFHKLRQEATLRLIDLNIGEDNCLADLIRVKTESAAKLCGNHPDVFEEHGFEFLETFKLEMVNPHFGGRGFALVIIPEGETWNLEDTEVDPRVFASVSEQFSIGDVLPNGRNIKKSIQNSIGAEKWDQVSDLEPTEDLKKLAFICSTLLNPLETEVCSSNSDCLEVISTFFGANFIRPQTSIAETLQAEAGFIEGLKGSLGQEVNDFSTPMKRTNLPVDCSEGFHNESSGTFKFSGLGKHEFYKGNCQDEIIVHEDEIIAIFWQYLYFTPDKNSTANRTSETNVECFRREEFVIITDFYNNRPISVSCISEPTQQFYKSASNHVKIDYHAQFFTEAHGYLAYYESFPRNVSDEVLAIREIEVEETFLNETQRADIIETENQIFNYSDTRMLNGPHDLRKSHNFMFSAEKTDDIQHLLHEISGGLQNCNISVVVLNDTIHEEEISALIMLESSCGIQTINQLNESIWSELIQAENSTEAPHTNFTLSDFDECSAGVCDVADDCSNVEGHFTCDPIAELQSHHIKTSSTGSLLVAGVIAIVIFLLLIVACIYNKCRRKTRTTYQLRHVSMATQPVVTTCTTSSGRC